MTSRRVPKLAELAPLLHPRRPALDPTSRRLASVACIADLRTAARRRAPQAVFDYTDGAAGDELTLARMRESYDRVEFRPTVLRDVSSVDPSTTILGRRSELPLVFAPTGFTRMMHTEGEPAVARVAARTGIPYTLSTMGTTSIERLAAEASETRLWFQLYMWRDREAGRDFVVRAAKAGYEALVLTVDTPVAGPRLRDVRNGLTTPPSLTLKTFLDCATRPAWWFDLLTTEPLEFASLTHFEGTVADLIAGMFDPAATLADVEWLRQVWKGPLVVKGIQSGEDAKAVVNAGADAVIVSNHGGRQLDRAPVPLEELPMVLDTVGDRAEVYIDGMGDHRPERIAGVRAALDRRRDPHHPSQRALVVAPGGRLRWRAVPAPSRPGPLGAVVHPLAVATGDMDRPIILATTPFPLPLQLGHECVAEIVEVGAESAACGPASGWWCHSRSTAGHARRAAAVTPAAARESPPCPTTASAWPGEPGAAPSPTSSPYPSPTPCSCRSLTSILGTGYVANAL